MARTNIPSTNDQPTSEPKLPDALQDRGTPPETTDPSQPVNREASPELDPFSEEALCLPANYVTDLSVQRVILSAPCDKPPKHLFFRVRPGQEWCRRAQVCEIEVGMTKDRYIIPHGVTGLEKIAPFVRDTLLYWTTSIDGEFRLWPIKLPPPDREMSNWTKTALQVAAIAETEWVRLVPASGCYEAHKAEDDFDEPVWPEKSWPEIFKIVFSDRLIVSADHPVVRALRGKKS